MNKIKNLNWPYLNYNVLTIQSFERIKMNLN